MHYKNVDEDPIRWEDWGMGKLQYLRLFASRIRVFLCKQIIALWARLGPLLLWPVPHYSRGGLYPQAVLVVVAYGCYRILSLAPGDSVAALAVVAVIMTVRTVHFTKGEQVVWVLIAFGLLFMETRVIHSDRDTHDAQQRQFEARQQAQFQATLDGFASVQAQNQAQFAATMKESKTIFGETKAVNAQTMKNLDAIIGGSDRPYFDISNDGGKPGLYSLIFNNKSDHPYRELKVMVIDVNKAKNLSDTLILTPADSRLTTATAGIGDIGMRQGYVLSGLVVAQRGEDLVRLRIEFSSLSGSWSEDIIIRTDKDGKQRKAIRIIDEKGSREVVVDKEFPRDSKGVINW